MGVNMNLIKIPVGQKIVEIDEQIYKVILSIGTIFWQDWLFKTQIPNLLPTRAGVARGKPIPIRGWKFLAAAASLLYPQLFKTTKELAEAISISHGVLRNWFGEVAFQKKVQTLENDFAHRIFTNLSNYSILEGLLYYSEAFRQWNDGVLKYLIINLCHALEKHNLKTFSKAGKVKYFEDFRFALGEDWKTFLYPKKDFPKDAISITLTGEILGRIADAYGRRKDLRICSAISRVIEPHVRSVGGLLKIYLDDLESIIKDGSPKEDGLKLLERIRVLTEIQERKITWPSK